MGFFDRGKVPASKASSSKPGNKGEGNAKDGYPFGSTTPGYIDYRDIANNGPFYEGTTRQRYQDDPNARKLHSPGSSRGEQSGWWKTSGKNLSDTHGPFSWTAEDEARDQALQAQRRADDDASWKRLGYSGSDWWKEDPEYQQLLASGNKTAAYRRKNKLLVDAKNDNALKAFIAQGGTEDTWRNRFSPDANWPKPRSPLGAYSHGPGRADWDTRFTNPPPPNTAGGGRSGGGSDAANTPQSGRQLNEWLRDHPGTQGGGDGMNAIQGYLGDTAMAPRQGMPQFAQAQGGPSDVLAALSRVSSMPPGAPTAALGDIGGFARAVSALRPTTSATKKPTIVRRGGGQVDMR